MIDPRERSEAWDFGPDEGSPITPAERVWMDRILPWRDFARLLILKDWARRCNWVTRWWRRRALSQGMMPAEFSDETNSEEDDMPQRDDDSDYDDDDRSVLARIEV